MTKEFLDEVKKSIDLLEGIDEMAIILDDLRERKGRLFVVGSGGSAGNASHAVSDFRKLCEIESYSFDNISELTARVNDDGWNNTTMEWLEASNFSFNDCLFVLSVGGGMPNISGNLVNAIEYASKCRAKIIGIVGNKECTLTQYADAFCFVPTKKWKTPIVEGLQMVICHLLVTRLQLNSTIW